MDPFLMVLAGHLLGDFIVQTDWQAANKEVDWWADLSHVITYHLTMVVLVLPFWLTWQAGLLLAASFASHAVIDRRWPTRWVLRVTRSQGFSTVAWGVIATDQALHLSILAILTFLLTRP